MNSHSVISATHPDNEDDVGEDSSGDVGGDKQGLEGSTRTDVADAPGDEDGEPAVSSSRWTPPRVALAAGILIVAALAALTGWLGWGALQVHRSAASRAEFLQVGRQGAVNLTTIDWQHADADIKRILDSATGTFNDDFAKRAQPFIDLVKQTHSKSEGTVAAAGLESITSDSAQVLVAMSVKTTNLGAQEQAPRAWRMRIDVEKTKDGLKVSNVEFVP